MLVCDQYYRYGQTEVTNPTADMTGIKRKQLVCAPQVRVAEDRNTIARLAEQLEAAQFALQVRQYFCHLFKGNAHYHMPPTQNFC